jgi:hypothetical protein
MYETVFAAVATFLASEFAREATTGTAEVPTAVVGAGSGTPFTAGLSAAIWAFSILAFEAIIASDFRMDLGGAMAGLVEMTTAATGVLILPGAIAGFTNASAGALILPGAVPGFTEFPALLSNVAEGRMVPLAWFVRFSDWFLPPGRNAQKLKAATRMIPPVMETRAIPGTFIKLKCINSLTSNFQFRDFHTLGEGEISCFPKESLNRLSICFPGPELLFVG